MPGTANEMIMAALAAASTRRANCVLEYMLRTS